MMFGQSQPQLLHSNDTGNIGFSGNHGQFPSAVLGYSPMPGGYAYVESDRFTYSLFDHGGHGKAYAGGPAVHATVQQVFEGANGSVIQGFRERSDYRNFYLGKDPASWQSHVPVYQEMRVPQFLPGVNLAFSDDGGYLKYTFHLEAGVEPSVLRWTYSGAISTQLEHGHLVTETSAGELREMKPIAWQVDEAGNRIRVPVKFAFRRGAWTFVLPKGWDKERALVIDPVLVFSSFSGSTSDNWGFTATYDFEDHAYGGGIVSGVGYPLTSDAYQDTFGTGNWDVGISKFSPDGTALIFSTYLGGAGNEYPSSLVADSQNRLVVFGGTGSLDFPTTAGAFQTVHNGGPSLSPLGNVSFEDGADFYVSRFSLDGTALNASTLIGGTDNECINQQINFNYGDLFRGEVIVNSQDRVIACGVTVGPDFPTAGSGVVSTNSGGQDGVVWQLTDDFSGLEWSTYVGGSQDDSAYALEAMSDGSIYMVGSTNSTDFPITANAYLTQAPGEQDGYIVHMAAGAIVAGSYVGTADYDQVMFVEQDTEGDIWITGQTEGSFPVQNFGYIDPGAGQYIAEFAPDLQSLQTSTTFGNANDVSPVNINPTAFLVDDCNRVFVSGWGGGLLVQFGGTTNMSVSTDAFQPATDNSDFYFAAFDVGAQNLLYATFLGGVGLNEHVDGGSSRFAPDGTIYQAVCAGCGGNSFFPTSDGAWSEVNNSSNCNMAVVKFDTEIEELAALASVSPSTLGCAPFEVAFNSQSTGTTHFWDFGDGTTSNDPNPVHVFESFGIYEVMYVTDNGGQSFCSTQDTAFLTIQVNVPLELDPDFTWSSDPCEALPTADFDYTGSNQFDALVWELGDANTVEGDASFEHVYLSSGFFTVTLNAIDAVCVDTVSVSQVIEVLEPTSVLASANLEDPIELEGCTPYVALFSNAGSVGPPGVWDFGNGETSSTDTPTVTYDEPGVYDISYIISDPESCNLADTANLQITVNPSVILEADFDFTVEPCSDTLLVDFEYTGSPGWHELLFITGDDVLYQDTAFTHLYDAPGSYTVILSAIDTLCGAISTVVEAIDIQPGPFFVEAEGAVTPASGCVPLDVTFDALDSNGDTFIWEFGNGESAEGTLVNYTYEESGAYTVLGLAIDSATCNIVDTTTLAINAAPLPVFNPGFVWNSPSCQAQATAQFEYTGNPNYDAIIWDMGDGTTYNTPSLGHIFPSPGTYTVSVSVADATCGYSETHTEEVTVVINETIEAEVIWPNVFTPNGDLQNALLRPKLIFEGGSEVIPSGQDWQTYFDVLEIQVFNRWGNLLFESSAEVPFWDGGDLNEGVYYYLVRYRLRCSEEGEQDLDGHLQLMR